MNHLRMYSSIVAFSLAILFPFGAKAAPSAPCQQLRRDLDREIDVLKDSQKNELQQCRSASGRNSDACRLLQDRQNQELSGRRADRSASMAACPVTARLDLLAEPSHITGDFGPGLLAARNDCEYPRLDCPPPKYFIGVPHPHHLPPHHGPNAQAKGGASGNNRGGNSASGGSSGHSGGSSSGSLSSSSGSSAGGYSGGSSTHSGYTGSSGGSSGSTVSSGGSSFSGGSAGGGGSIGGGSHDSGGGGRRSN